MGQMCPALSSDYFRLATLTNKHKRRGDFSLRRLCSNPRRVPGGFRRLTEPLGGSSGEALCGTSHHIAVMRKVYYPIGQALVLSPVDSRTW